MVSQSMRNARVLRVAVVCAALCTLTASAADFAELEQQFLAHYSAGRLSEAEPIARQMLQIAEQSYRDRPQIVANCAGNLAVPYESLGRYADANIRRSSSPA